jgi:hypothetical protein
MQEQITELFEEEDNNRDKDGELVNNSIIHNCHKKMQENMNKVNTKPSNANTDNSK